MARILEGKNRPSPSEAASFVSRFEEFEAEIETEKSKFMLACKAIRGRQRELLDDAKSQGVAKGVVKAVCKARKFEAKARDAMAEFDEPDDRDYAADIAKALGGFADLPLGAAAIAAGKPDATTAAVVAAVEADMTDAEWQQAGVAASGVVAGMTPPV